ncbi:hypothetical protein ES703_91902 [subsurface metagenome]
MMPPICSRIFAVGVIFCASRYSSWDISVAASRASSASNRPSLLPKWYFTSAALTPDFCAMSDSDTSIEARSIINSLAAISNFSAVGFLPVRALVGTLVFNCGPCLFPLTSGRT